LERTFYKKTLPNAGKVVLTFSLFPTAGIAQSAYRRATGWTAGVPFPAGARDFSLLHGVQTYSGSAQPPIQWVLGTIYVGVKLIIHLIQVK
jgi:hypothetical protein